jgi:hypothetical protein
MAISSRILGTNVFVYDGSTMIACAKSITINSTRKEIDVTCSGSGDFEQAKVGKQKVTWDIDLLDRQLETEAEDTANVTTYDFITKYEGKTELTLVLKDSTLTAGEETYTGVGYITSIKLSAVDDSAESFTCSGFFNSFSKTRVTLTGA